MAPEMWILWVKALHVLAIISWMAGMLYLPRLMVYHVETAVGSPEDERFKVMERRLLKAITTPASLVALITGLVLAFASGYLDVYSYGNFWFWLKMLSVVALFAMHGRLSRHVREFAGGERKYAARYFRIINEVPTVLMIIIVVMVIVRPF
jgi:protoporphyrinogen IX oxidase